MRSLNKKIQSLFFIILVKRNVQLDLAIYFSVLCQVQTPATVHLEVWDRAPAQHGASPPLHGREQPQPAGFRGSARICCVPLTHFRTQVSAGLLIALDALRGLSQP